MSLFRKSGFAAALIAVVLNSLFMVGWIVAQDNSTPEAPHWSYEGQEGPEFWGTLSDQFAACSAGLAQSPIDILNPATSNLPDIQFNYHPSAITIENNGHTIQVDYDPGSNIVLDGDTYMLQQFHFHHPSEHTINGVVYPMEMHLVHADANGNLAVVAVLIQEGVRDNPGIEPVWNVMPSQQIGPLTFGYHKINATDLLPKVHIYYAYTGSLTTPPCTEGVHWIVMRNPILLSVAQINAFSSLFELDARPVQPLNGRDVTQDSGADS